MNLVTELTKLWKARKSEDQKTYFIVEDKKSTGEITGEDITSDTEIQEELRKI